MSVTGFFHSGVTVSDMDEARCASTATCSASGGDLRRLDGAGRSAARVWGMEPGKVRIVFLRVPGSDTVLEFFDFQTIERHPSASARPCDYGAGHMCLYVDDAESPTTQRALEHGFHSRGGEVVTIEKGRTRGPRRSTWSTPTATTWSCMKSPPRRLSAYTGGRTCQR